MKIIFQKYILIWFLLLGSVSSIAQDIEYDIDFLTTEDGLRSNNIHAVLKDSRGLVWVGTNSGLHCYDGQRFTFYANDNRSELPLSNNNVLHLFEDSLSQIWVVYFSEIDIINLENQTVKTLFKEEKSTTNLPNLQPIENQGEIWLVKNGVLGKVVQDTFQVFGPIQITEVEHFNTDSLGNFWLRNRDEIVGIQPDGKLINRKEFPFQVQDKLFDKYTFHAFDKHDDGSLYFCSRQLDQVAAPGYTNYTKILPNGSFQAIDDRQSKLITSSRFLYKKKREILIDFRKYYQDGDGIIWWATGNGLAKMVEKSSVFEAPNELKGISHRGMYQHTDGMIYGGNYPPGSFYRFNPTTQTYKFYPEINNIYSISHYRGDSIFLAGQGVGPLIFDVKKEKIVDYIPDYDHYISSLNLFVDSKKNVWMISFRRLSYASFDSPLDFKTFQDKDGSNFYEKTELEQIGELPDGTLWVGGKMGFQQIDKEKGILQSWTTQGEEGKKLSGIYVRRFHTDAKGNFWIATENGLNYLDRKSGRIQNYTVRDGLIDNNIFSMLVENEQFIWLGTANGLSRFDVVNKTFLNYYEKDGIVNNEFNRVSTLKANDGTIYMGTITGMTIFNPKKVQNHIIAFRPMLSQYLKFDLTLGIERSYLFSEKNAPIVVKPEEEDITFLFSNSDYTKPHKNSYAVKLEGIDEDWVSIGHTSSKKYSDLPAGNYVFKLKSANSNGIWSDQILEVPFVIQQHFYESKWFLGFCLISIFLMIVWFFYNRWKNIQKRLSLRVKLARDLHDEMSNSFNNIRIVAKEMDPSDPKKIKKDARIIHELSGEAIIKVEDAIWALDGNELTFREMIDRHQDFLDDVIRGKNIPLTFRTEDIEMNMKLNYVYRRNMVLIFKEAITNIVKHSKPTNVDIHFYKEKSQYFFRVTSNYSELIESKYSTGKGIPGMRDRAKLVDGRIEIEHSPNKFQVLLVVKDPKA